MDLESKETDIKIEYSEQFSEVLIREPSWFYQWGITVFVFLILVLFFVTWLIRYPDVLNAEIIVTTQNQPVDVYTQSTGKIEKIFVEEGQKIKKGTILALMENKARFEDIEQLSMIVDRNVTPTTIENRFLLQKFQLGEIQDTYHTFLNDYTNYQLIKKEHAIDKEIAVLESQKTHNESLIMQLNTTYIIFQEELQLIEKDFLRDKKLHSLGHISDTEYEAKRLMLLQKKREEQSIQMKTANIRIAIGEINRTITQLSNKKREIEVLLQQSLELSFKKLKGELVGWKKKFLLLSLSDGFVTFADFLKENQFVNSNEHLFTIIPKESLEYIGQVNMPVFRSGKVKIGQRVNIKLDTYPYEEYGMLVGKVSSMSLTPKNGFYIVYISLNQGITTIYGKELVFKQKMKGTAEIITEDLRLIERIFYQLRKIFT